jgi:hypothetical protein
MKEVTSLQDLPGVQRQSTGAHQNLPRLIFFLASEPTEMKGNPKSSLSGYYSNTARQQASMTPFIHSFIHLFIHSSIHCDQF